MPCSSLSDYTPRSLGGMSSSPEPVPHVPFARPKPDSYQRRVEPNGTNAERSAQSEPGTKAEPKPDAEEEYEVEAILKHKFSEGVLTYFVAWGGTNEKTWEPEENVENAPEVVLKYWVERARETYLKRRKDNAKDEETTASQVKTEIKTAKRSAADSVEPPKANQQRPKKKAKTSRR